LPSILNLQIEEKRDSPRSPLDAEITGVFLDQLNPSMDQPRLLLRGKVENISRGGVGVLSDEQAPAEGVVRCEIAIPGSLGHIPTLLRTRWCDRVEGQGKYRLGLEFLV
jgi:PilZ domain